MYRLIVLGESSLQDASGRSVLSVMSQPRRYGLLLYLTLAGPGRTIRRDSLLSLFWPDLAEGPARHALRQALLHLRQSVGRETVTGNRQEDVGVDHNHLLCDAVQFRAAVAQGAYEDAVRLYRGALLPGFFLDNCSSEFEQWLETERAALRRMAGEAAWKAAAAAAATGNAAAAGAYARVCAGLTRDDEALFRRSLTLLGDLRDQAGAIALYDDYARWLREEYEAEPSAESRALLDSIRRSCAVAVAVPTSDYTSPSERVDPDPPSASLPAANALQRSTVPISPSKQGRFAFYGVAALVMVVLVSLWGLNFSNAPEPMTSATPRLLIEPVQDYTDSGGAQRLAAALTDAIAGRIADAHHIEIVPSITAPAEVITPPRRPVFVLRTGIRDIGDGIRGTAVLIDGPSRAIVAYTKFAGTATATGTIVDNITATLAEFVNRELSNAAVGERLTRGSRNARALALVRDAIEDRKRADSLRVAGAREVAAVWLHKADSVLALAQAISPEWTEPTLQRGETELKRMWLVMVSDGVLTEARAALARGLEHAQRLVSRNRDDPAALEMRAVVNYWLWQTLPPDSAAGAHLLAQAIVSDLQAVVGAASTSGRAWNLLSAMLYARGDWHEAYWAADRARRADRYGDHSNENAVRLFHAALESQLTVDAGAACDDLGRRLGSDPAHAYCRMMLLASSSRSPTLEQAVTADRIAGGDFAPPWGARIAVLHAIVLAAAGHAERAEHALARGIAAGAGDPELAPLEAWARIRLGDVDQARKLLSRYVAGSPHTRGGILESTRFAQLRRTAAK